MALVTEELKPKLWAEESAKTGLPRHLMSMVTDHQNIQKLIWDQTSVEIQMERKQFGVTLPIHCKDGNIAIKLKKVVKKDCGVRKELGTEAYKPGLDQARSVKNGIFKSHNLILTFLNTLKKESWQRTIVEIQKVAKKQFGATPQILTREENSATLFMMHKRDQAKRQFQRILRIIEVHSL